MADHIPFINSSDDVQIYKSSFSDSAVVRLSLKTLDKTKSVISGGQGVWIDPSIDGLDQWPKVDNDYRAFVTRFVNAEMIGDRNFHRTPKEQVVQGFVNAVLDECIACPNVAWLTIPQLPCVSDSSRNKLNRMLATCSAEWKGLRAFKGKLILPVIFTHQKQVNNKTERNKRIEAIKKCFESSEPGGVWIVDSSLSDYDGSSTNEQRRFPGLISFHRELSAMLPRETTTVGGPYWGLNIVLWARGQIQHPAIGLGSSFQYYVPARAAKAAKPRLALVPLRRLAFAGHLRGWLPDALNRLAQEDEARSELAELAKHVDRLLLSKYSCRLQIATFYKKWFDKIASVSPSGRALALYQDLSSAFVIGKSLPDLHREEGTARRTYVVAKQLMVHCL